MAQKLLPLRGPCWELQSLPLALTFAVWARFQGETCQLYLPYRAREGLGAVLLEYLPCAFILETFLF